jgi:hypothetical protein
MTMTKVKTKLQNVLVIDSTFWCNVRTIRCVNQWGGQNTNGLDLGYARMWILDQLAINQNESHRIDLD